MNFLSSGFGYLLITNGKLGLYLKNDIFDKKLLFLKLVMSLLYFDHWVTVNRN